MSGKIDHDSYSDASLRNLLNSVKSVAVVGASPNWNRPSYFVMKYLQDKGYRILPVNPRAAGEEILGEKVYASLAEIPENFDMVDVFRNSEVAGAVTDEAIALKDSKDIKAIWMQLTVRNDAAAARAEAAGLQVVMDRCPKIEFGRLNSELSWGGFNSKVISAKRRKVRIG
ncbi:CoA-binding protein [Denitrobaculum tricleocarpae]|uniref:CoA-binding protein n=1 Tax=Denitrobaculum tricleocarpae TaxID=2591009 RepID=UPI0015D29AF5|nr:CoA-binding protein [Denitrobaculum tricleocarpae]